MTNRHPHLIVALLTLGFVGCLIAAPQTNFTGRQPPADGPAPMRDFIRAYDADRYNISTFHDLPWSETRFARHEQLARDWQAKLAKVGFEALDQTGRVDYLLLRDELDRSLARIARHRRQLAELDGLLKFREAILRLEEARCRGEAVDSRAAATKVADVAKQAKEAKEQIEKAAKAKKEPIAPMIALRAADAVKDLRGALKRWFEFYNGFQPEFSWWVKTPHGAADKALEECAKFLREEIAGQKGKDEDPLVGEAIGAGALAEEIRFEWLPYAAEELIAIGQRELAWCEAEMRKAARAMGGGDDWKAAMAKVKADFVPPGEQDELVARTAREAIAFTKKHRFVTVPALCEETWRLTMMSPETLKTIPYAAYSSQQMMVAYAREDMPQEDKLMVMRGNNRAFTRLVVPHELIPGHHLQIFQATRHDPYRQMFRTPFYVEGWALHCELRFWELGWARTPQERIGMLFWRMTRAARIIVTLKFHLGQMKPEEMVNFFVERVGHERLGATSEIRRFIGRAPPLYQAGYLLGGLQLRALRSEMQLPDQQFNDAVLAVSPIPIELLRAELRRSPLTRDARPSWRFDGAR
ncbi:MAG: DUF885 domain-containing protein [Verrucomicrobia bacterium]|nr:DUF885 domain-containing protein [Verrucomicrobiota bacterium]